MRLLLTLGFLQATVATVGSLYFSEVLLLPPCDLCWYQRALMYPQFFLFGIALLVQDSRVWRYSLPMSVLGFGIALYHTLLYENILSSALETCRSGISCTSETVRFIGPITLPSLSLIAFTILVGIGIAMMIVERRKTKNSTE